MTLEPSDPWPTQRSKRSFPPLQPGRCRPAVFLSYRRKDVPFVTTHLRDKLPSHLWGLRVLRDIEDLPWGEALRRSIRARIEESTVVLVLIGKDWAPQRLRQEEDWVRFELETARSLGRPILPVFVELDAMPADLPEAFGWLKGLLAARLRTADLKSDLRNLARKGLARHVWRARGQCAVRVTGLLVALVGLGVLVQQAVAAFERPPEPYVRIEAGTVDIEGRTATVEAPFLMKRTEVTQAEWARVMDQQPAYFTACGPDCPVERVSWCDAAAFSNRLSEEEGLSTCYRFRSGPDLDTLGCPGALRSCLGPPCEVELVGPGCRGYRLPTWAEWRRAMVGLPDIEGLSDAAAFQTLDPWAWFGGNAAVSYPSSADCSGLSGRQVPGIDRCGPHPVGTKMALPNGLVDGLGNVWEWTQASGDVGGGWQAPAGDTRPGARYAPDRAARACDLGFRVVRTVALE